MMRRPFGVVLGVAALVIIAIVAWMAARLQTSSHGTNVQPVRVVNMASGVPTPAPAPLPAASPTPSATTVPYTPEPERVSRIVAEFLAIPVAAPAGLKSAAELNAIFMTEQKTPQSDRSAAELRHLLQPFKALDRGLIDDGVSCRRTMCRVVGRFDSGASSEELSTSMRGLQAITEDQLRQADIDSRMTIGFHGSNIMAFYKLKPAR